MANQAKANRKTSKSSFLYKLGVLLLVIYFILGCSLLVLRYWVPNHIDGWRPQIESNLSAKLDLNVSLDNIDLKWQGWRPILSLNNIDIRDKSNNQLLNIPTVSTNLNWSALFGSKKGLISLQVVGMDLGITRKTDGDLRILGQDISITGDELIDLPWLTFLLQQPYISFTDTRIRWHDLLRQAPELDLGDVSITMAHDNENNIGLHLKANVAQVANTNLQLKLIVANSFQVPNIDLTTTRAWVSLSSFDVNEWAAWMDFPTELESGSFDMQFWLHAKPHNPYLTGLIKATNFGIADDNHEIVKNDELNLWLDADLASLNHINILKPEIGLDSVQAVNFDVAAKNLYLHLADTFAHALVLDKLNTSGVINNSEHQSIQIDSIKLANPDLQAVASGSWHSGGKAGFADIKGKFAYANLATIYKYLPLEVNADAREWLATGLLSGDLKDADFYVKGDLYDFPFGQNPDSGDFRISGAYDNGRIEFVPGAKPKDKWPQIYAMRGHADLHRATLNLLADSALISPQQGKDIELTNVRGDIPDLEYDAVLNVAGETQADGDTYMALINNTPLSYMLNNIFAQAQASGQWQVPLGLEVPLLNSIDTKVQGTVNFADASLQFFPEAPVISNINGVVGFTEEGINIDKPVMAKLLGDQLQLTGDLGGNTAQGLNLKGTVTAKAIGDFAGVKGMHRIQGSLNYAGVLKQDKDHYVLDLNSDTQGFGIDLPAPLSKPKEEKRSLHVLWSDADNINERLKIDFGNVINMDLFHKKNQTKGPYFHIAAIGVQQLAQAANTSGLSINVAYPLVDLDNWDNIIDEFAQPLDESTGESRPLWPDLSLFSVQADQLRAYGTRLDHAVLRLHKKDDANWSLNIRSEQTSGTLKWHQDGKKVVGLVQGNFDQLSLGDDPADTSSLLPEPDNIDRIIDEKLDIPAMVLEANNLRVYGHSYGHLNLEGTRDSKNDSWILDRLRIGDKDTAILKGTGVWNLEGAKRGLSLNADVEMADLGAWMKNAGWHDVVSGGDGLVKAKFEWLDLPWTTDKSKLSGSMNAELNNGRFDKIGSNTAKLLEFLSLQSITRLNKLDKGLSGLGKEGFPFDQLHGKMQLANGDVEIEDYKVIGPIGTILLEGKANIIRQDMQLDAVVVPNIDVSGAALAAGIAINPLVGLGAFVTQWLLKEPLAKSMTVRYLVSGSWDDPQVEEVPIKAKTDD